jgi:acyl-CoA synthetase (NDP forming)
MAAAALDGLLRPDSIAVVGASSRPDSYGYKAVSNLLDFGFGGRLYPVHPTADEVAGLPCYPTLADLPEQVDCAVVALPAAKVLPVLEEVAAHGASGAVVFASGFAEAGPEGRETQAAMRRLAQASGLKVCGPNGLGFVNVHDRIAAYGAPVPESTTPGGLAAVCQSGSVCILLNSLGRFGFTYLVSSGNEACVNAAEYLEFLAHDPATRVICCYLESVAEPERFAAAAAAVATAGKPVVALKVGRSDRGRAATVAHTGALTGSAAAHRDFFRRCGVVAVDDLDELIETAALLLGVAHPPRGRSVAIVNVSGGENGLTCDIAESVGLPLSDFSSATVDRLQELLPPYASVVNPFDAGSVMFDLDSYRRCLETIAADPDVAVLAVSQDCPPALGSEEAAIYRRLTGAAADLAPRLDKPLLCFTNSSNGVHPDVAEPLVRAGVPLLQGTRASLVAVRHLLDREAGGSAGAPLSPRPPAVADAAWRARLATGKPLPEREAKRFLTAHAVGTAADVLATSRDEAAEAARRFGRPVVLKVESPDVLHKTEAGGVRLNVASPEAAAAAYDDILASVTRHSADARIEGVSVQEMVMGGVEVLVGLSREEPFGLGLVVAPGGIFTELLDDAAFGLLPVDAARAETLIAETRLAKLLAGFRGAPPADIAALVELIVRFGEVAAAYGDLIQEADLNPVVVLPAGEGVRILDALILPRRPESEGNCP